MNKELFKVNKKIEMARKVFISLLGSGTYEKGMYGKGSTFVSSSTRFIQQATLEYLDAKKWSSEDAAYILTTERAYADNWECKTHERFNKRTNVAEKYIGLREVLKEMKLPFEPEPVSISEGKDEKEIWEIFDAVFSKIEENDELYFDFTHGFRYLPMLILVLGNYAKFLKGATVKSITYGNHENRDSETNVAPIVDILPLSVLQDWTTAAADYIENGNTGKISSLSEVIITPILAATQGADEQANRVRRLTKYLTEFTQSMSLCRGNVLLSAEKQISKYLKQSVADAEEAFIAPLRPLIKKIGESIGTLTDEPSVFNMVQAAKINCKYGQYQAAVTMLQEGTVSFLCEALGWDPLDEKKRNAIDAALGIFGTEKENRKDQWTGDKELIEAALGSEWMRNKDFVGNVKSLKATRNDINHAGMKENARDATKLKKRIEDSLDKIACYISPSENQIATKVGRFVNLSNHPSTQ